MKKILFGTTALVSAAVLTSSPASAEEGIKLGLGGYMNNFFGVGAIDEDDADPRDPGHTGLYSDGEVHFKGETTLDNGITFGAQVQLESFTSGDQIDENYAYISGSFGRVVLGSENTAAYLMHYSAPNVGVPINSGWVTVFIPVPPGSTTGFRTPGVSTYLDIGNDNNGITYFTPRFSGFQFGVSYVPTVPGAVTGIGSGNGTGDGRNFNSVFSDQDSEYHDVFSVGANFVESFNSIDVAVSAGYRHAEGPDAAPFDAFDDIDQYSVGLNLGYAGFTVGGSYAVEDSDRAFDGWAMDVGASYSTGPWSFGVTYFRSEVEGTAGGDDDEMQALEAGVSYAVGPGITASLSGLWGEWDNEEGLENDGIVGVAGIKFSF